MPCDEAGAGAGEGDGDEDQRRHQVCAVALPCGPQHEDTRAREEAADVAAQTCEAKCTMWNQGKSFRHFERVDEQLGGDE